MRWLLLVALFVIVWVYLFCRYTGGRLKPMELYMDYINPKGGPEGLGVDLANFKQGLPLADMLTPDPALSDFGYEGAAARDSRRQMELGGQYLQRTNNYRHNYPDNGSAFLADFDNAVYNPKALINTVVPCNRVCPF